MGKAQAKALPKLIETQEPPVVDGIDRGWTIAYLFEFGSPINRARLADELRALFGDIYHNCYADGDDKQVTIMLNKPVDKDKVIGDLAMALEAHDPNIKSEGELKREKKEADRAALIELAPTLAEGDPVRMLIEQML